MLRLPSKKADKVLSLKTRQYLADKQQDIDSKATYKMKKERSKSLWDSKGEKPFKEIREQLAAICPAQESCCYCERNEATDIEHIFPKTAFPKFTFSWEKYLLACSNCNSNYN
jgi:hypothetical protein